MRIVSVTQVKSHLSALLSQVECAQTVQISRRGRVIARLVPEPEKLASASFDFDALAAFVDAQAATDNHSVEAMRASSPVLYVGHQTSQKLGSRIAARFADLGLTEPLPEL